MFKGPGCLHRSLRKIDLHKVTWAVKKWENDNFRNILNCCQVWIFEYEWSVDILLKFWWKYVFLKFCQRKHFKEKGLDLTSNKLRLRKCRSFRHLDFRSIVGHFSWKVVDNQHHIRHLGTVLLLLTFYFSSIMDEILYCLPISKYGNIYLLL